jgi:hypothetical protein
MWDKRCGMFEKLELQDQKLACINLKYLIINYYLASFCKFLSVAAR